MTCSTPDDVYYWARITLDCGTGSAMYIVEFRVCYPPCTSNLGTLWTWILMDALMTLDCTATHEDVDFTHDSINHGVDGPCGDSTTWPTITLN